jgi:ArsR family transcriptional regulator
MPAPALPTRTRGVSNALDVPLQPEETARRVEVLKALADPTRLEIVAILRRASEPICVCDLTATFDLSQPTLSHHLARLKEAGLLEVHRGGIWSYYSLPAPLAVDVERVLDALLPA